MRMTPEHFFELFLKELEQREEMHRYYKFLGESSSFHFRKNYFLERLRYIDQHISDPSKTVWDCGSGYGTTCLFLAMNGIKTHGTTLEFYYETVAERYAYWNQYGDASLFTCSYENLFDSPPQPSSYDLIIVQDTLHHLEPINDALRIFHDSLKTGGKILAIEENGNNIIQNAKLYKYRGNKRIIKLWDEKLQKDILIGNENIRSLKHWNELLQANQFAIDNDSVQYIRYFLPFRYKNADPEGLLKKEKDIQRRSKFRKEYFFFGINFVAEKK
ncbi:MAG: class I SAM-dependent methyltransferase [Sphingobacteriales bacterium]|nr:MAG: class I SAM-dependent methyltransferase [Sphingobacteriales bacterium]